MFFAVIRKRVAAMVTMAVPRTMSASPAVLPDFWPGSDSGRRPPTAPQACKEQVEFFHDKSKGHDGNRSPHPLKKRALIRRVIYNILDHLARLDWRLPERMTPYR
jgi:hypothetical protein